VSPPPGLTVGADGLARCRWAGSHEDYVRYHDQEWGRPVGQDRRLFEKLCLEGFQSGLSWLTILRKRAAFRRAFAGFDPDTVAAFDAADVDRLLTDAGIVRNRAKIEATIRNARRMPDLVAEFGSFAAYVWAYEPVGARPAPDHATLSVTTTSPQATAMSKDLRRRGWSFVGPTTAYAMMQSVGVVDDHLAGCAVRAEVEAERRAFHRPVSPSPLAGRNVPPG
jgi:DNA-3-methyladenine glycosylase I